MSENIVGHNLDRETKNMRVIECLMRFRDDLRKCELVDMTIDELITLQTSLYHICGDRIFRENATETDYEPIED
jgi:hypothetical protein